MFEMYERIIKFVSAVIAICCMVWLWNSYDLYETSQRYLIKEIEYESLENYALETAKNLKEEDINISKEEIARRKKDNYKVVEEWYVNDNFYVKVQSDIAEVVASIPVSTIEKSRDVDTVDFSITYEYTKATYTRKATIHHLIEYIGMAVVVTVSLALIFYMILFCIGAVVAGIILLIKLIVKKIKKQ